MDKTEIMKEVLYCKKLLDESDMNPTLETKLQNSLNKIGKIVSEGMSGAAINEIANEFRANNNV